jgi:hypothetical protein
LIDISSLRHMPIRHYYYADAADYPERFSAADFRFHCRCHYFLPLSDYASIITIFALSRFAAMPPPFDQPITPLSTPTTPRFSPDCRRRQSWLMPPIYFFDDHFSLFRLAIFPHFREPPLFLPLYFRFRRQPPPFTPLSHMRYDRDIFFARHFADFAAHILRLYFRHSAIDTAPLICCYATPIFCRRLTFYSAVPPLSRFAFLSLSRLFRRY